MVYNGYYKVMSDIPKPLINRMTHNSDDPVRLAGGNFTHIFKAKNPMKTEEQRGQNAAAL